MTKHSTTSWEEGASWYNNIVGKDGHYYHKELILPCALRLLKLQKQDSLLDLGCGQGILARHIPKDIQYVGIDIAKSLIDHAKKYSQGQKSQKFLVSDITQKLPLGEDELFSHAACLLALQNVEHPELVLRNAASHLRQGATFLLIINHPCFRIPRQSDWGFDEATKRIYRKMFCYKTPQRIPIETHPGKEKKIVTWSFHHPLESYFKWLHEAGLMVAGIEELYSEKESIGKAAKLENRARKEFPLFLAIRAKMM
jgi:ubiquinone/menaquinone biosynthesis C-methylase UbiE